ncbi:MAG: DUF1275 family protein [Cycloclasticus pugetii]|uniref:DUF1275 family protein n=1 Tax=Cycloclasticus pugetii TaxID=34068 RepID=UPI003A8F157D
MFTDLGIMLGELVKGNELDKRKAKLFLTIIIGFILGGTLGSLLFLKYHFMALLFPASICLLISLVYRLYSKQHH